ncbi:MAG: hypothetical protein IJK30_00735 [Ruminococcus sp.]|nr:hypothetical protein [Ruminococcus sp.]
MKKVISTQAIMANGKTTYTGLFTSEGIPAEVELVCINGNACLSVTIPEDDEEEYVGRPLTEDEIEAICRNYGNCDDCPLYNYCDEEMM